MRRTQKRKIVIREVVKLKGASFECISEPHELYTTFPIESPAPCLAVVSVRDGVHDWRGMIVALPEDAPFEEFPAPEIASALGIIETIEEERIKIARSLNFVSTLDGLSYREAPFSYVNSVELDNAFEWVKMKLVSHKCLSQAACRKFDTFTQELIFQRLAECQWSPVVIWKVVDFSKHKDNWELLKCWRRLISDLRDLMQHRKDTWKANPRMMQALAASKRQSTENAIHDFVYRDAIAILDLKFQAMVAGHTRANLLAEVDFQKQHVKTLKKDLTAFRHRLSYLGLPVTRELLKKTIGS